MWPAIREVAYRVRRREPIVWIACVVLLALIASGWIVGALERLFSVKSQYRRISLPHTSTAIAEESLEFLSAKSIPHFPTFASQNGSFRDRDEALTHVQPP